MVDRLKKALHELWAPSRYTIPVNQGQLTQARLTDKAFTLQDAPAVKSPPAAAVKDTSRPRIVSPGVLEDLSAATVGAPSLEHDGVLPVSGRARTSRASERAAAAAAATAGERLVEEPRDDELDETHVRGSGSGTGVSREGGTEGGEGEIGGVHSPDIVSEPKESPDQARREEPSVASGDALPLHTQDGRGQKQTPKPSFTPKRRAVESCEASQPAAGVVSQDAATVDGRRRGAGAGADSPGQGELESQAERTSRKKNRRDGATQSGGSSRTEAVTSDDGNGATTSPAGEVTGARSEHTAAVGAPPASSGALTFDMQSILGGCRKASRLKRKRDARNASAHSFSGKLAGGGAELQDLKAAERTFSRVLNKVGAGGQL